jgi:hypothetical protein
MQRTLAIAFAFHALAAPARAQDEAALRSYFEGRTVIVKVAMPATEAGIDVYPGAAQPVDYPELAKRMKKNGIAIQAGRSALVTKLKVKGNLIEFQLDGGGYGTSGDPTDATVWVESVPKTQREKDLEQAVKKETDPTLKRRLQGEALATASAGAGPAEAAPPAEPQAGPLALWKGMAVDEADRLLGAPASTSDRKEGTLAVNLRTYDSAPGRVLAEFVEGVLVRFTITSR